MDGSTPNFKTWNILYPVYINSKKTIAEGRRISASKACENPTALEIGDCCGHLKIPFAIEVIFLNKLYQFFNVYSILTQDSHFHFYDTLICITS